MKKRLLLDGVNVHGNYPAVDEAVEHSFSVFTNCAYASLTFLYQTVMAAEVASCLFIGKLFVEQRLMHMHIISGLAGMSRTSMLI